jgi:hypothetical protein
MSVLFSKGFYDTINKYQVCKCMLEKYETQLSFWGSQYFIEVLIFATSPLKFKYDSILSLEEEYLLDGESIDDTPKYNYWKKIHEELRVLPWSKYLYSFVENNFYIINNKKLKDNLLGYNQLYKRLNIFKKMKSKKITFDYPIDLELDDKHWFVNTHKLFYSGSIYDLSLDPIFSIVGITKDLLSFNLNTIFSDEDLYYKDFPESTISKIYICSIIWSKYFKEILEIINKNIELDAINDYLESCDIPKEYVYIFMFGLRHMINYGILRDFHMFNANYFVKKVNGNSYYLEGM